MAENSTEAKKVALPSFYGVKAGMTRVFDATGNHVPVTVIKLIPNFISQVKTQKNDGYEAYQVAYGEKREKLVSNPVKGHLKKANIDNSLVHFAEIKPIEAIDENCAGSEVALDSFEESTYVDVTGISKGKGFQGFIKRHGFAGGPAAHGSHFHRHGGSIGCRATPGKVFRQKKMPGHMGSKQRTTQNLQVVEVNTEKGYMLIKGSVPGAKNGFVRIAKAIKKG